MLIRRCVVWTSAGLLLLVLAACLYLQLSMRRALDETARYSAAAASLPVFAGADGLARVVIEDRQFRVRFAGFEDNPTGPVVLLLHGFPVTSAMWLPLFESLVDAGLRVVAPDQRGYSPGARPESVTAYRVEALTGDVIALADALAIERFHLVGHDWGAVVGWQVARTSPERLLSWSALSIPHPLALSEAMETDSDQRRRSRYMRLLRLPWLPEALMARDGFAILRAFSDDFPSAVAREYLGMFAEPGAATAALNWYRAMPENLHQWPGTPSIDVPTLFIWGSGDGVVSEAAVAMQRQYLSGPYREQQVDAGHRLVLAQRSEVLRALLAHIAPAGTAR